ncbi:hypothetical protein D3C76_1457830 [compost metagenome]
MATVAEGKAAAVFLREGIGSHFTVAGWDHETVFVVGDRQVAVHLFHLFHAQADFVDSAGIGHAFHGLRAFVVAHRHHAFQGTQHWSRIARAQHIRQILHRNAQTFDGRQNAVGLRQTTGVGVRLDR